MAFGKKKAEVPAGRIQVTPWRSSPIVDPPAETIRRLVLDLAGNPGECLVVAQVADDETYVQVVDVSDGRWVVEHRAGSEETHAHADVPDVHTAAAIVVAWVEGDPGWHDMAHWQEGNGA